MERSMKKGLIIGVLIGLGVTLIAGGITAVSIFVIGKNNKFVKTDGFEPTTTGIVAKLCSLEAAQEAEDFYKKEKIMVNADPIDPDWDHDYKIEATDRYTEDGYPVYIYSWNGRYNKTKVRYKCALRTNKNEAKIMWIKQLSTKVVVKEDPQLYDKDGNKVYSDNL